MEKIKELLDKVAGQSILFSTFILGSLIILFAIIYTNDYFIYGFVIFLYSLIAISCRLFFKDIKYYWLKTDDKIRWVFWIYHLFQFLLIGILILVFLMILIHV